MSAFPGITNYEIHVPGTDVTAFLAKRDWTPGVWIYSLWTGTGYEDDTECVATGDLDLRLKDKVNLYKIRPDQVARVAFLLEFEYKS